MVAIKTEHATNVLKQILLDLIVIYGAMGCVLITHVTGGRVSVLYNVSFVVRRVIQELVNAQNASLAANMEIIAKINVMLAV